jgi:hypothetical protein
MNIDIVKLIETNSITKLNGNYQNKLKINLQIMNNNYFYKVFIVI